MEENKKTDNSCCHSDFLHFWWVKLLLGLALAVIVFGLGWACGQRSGRSSYFKNGVRSFPRANYTDDATAPIGGGMMNNRRLNGYIQPEATGQVGGGVANTSSAAAEPVAQ